jgi:hemerythrin
MNLLVWNPDWETGVPMIDDQHRELFRRVDALMSAIHMDDAKETVPGLLGFLADYVTHHFQAEEAEMVASRYPGLDQHRQIHADMAAKVAAMLRQVETNPASLTDDVLEFITEWLVMHINGVDRQMAHHLIRWAGSHPTAQA